MAGATLAWVRCGDGGERRLRDLVGPHTRVRSATLESVYLAMTDYSAHTVLEEEAEVQ